MKAVLAQVDSMGPDIEDGGKGWVLIDDSGLLLVWGVGVLLLSYTTPGTLLGSQAKSADSGIVLI